MTAPDKQQKTVEEHTLLAAPGASTVYDAIYSEGESELARSSTKLAWSGLGAGLSMGFSFLAEALLTTHAPENITIGLISKLGYCVGFVIVILGRQQLFTENTVTPILPLFRHRDMGRFLAVTRLWTVVLISNLVGAALFAGLVGWTQPLKAEALSHLNNIASDVAATGSMENFVGGIFAGWLIASLVWLLPFAGNSRVLVIILITYLIGLGGFSHIIAGSVEVTYACLFLGHPVSASLLEFFLPTLIGNVVGGVALVSVINHNQVIEE